MLSHFSHVQLFVTLWTVAHRLLCPWDFPGKKIPEWVAISYSRGSSRPRDQIHICIVGRVFTTEPLGKTHNIKCFSNMGVEAVLCISSRKQLGATWKQLLLEPGAQRVKNTHSHSEPLPPALVLRSHPSHTTCEHLPWARGWWEGSHDLIRQYEHERPISAL